MNLCCGNTLATFIVGVKGICSDFRRCHKLSPLLAKFHPDQTNAMQVGTRVGLGCRISIFDMHSSHAFFAIHLNHRKRKTADVKPSERLPS